MKPVRAAKTTTMRLEAETRQLEEKLKAVQLMKELDSSKRALTKEGFIWRSATQTQALRGYEKQVLENKAKPESKSSSQAQSFYQNSESSHNTQAPVSVVKAKSPITAINNLQRALKEQQNCSSEEEDRCPEVHSFLSSIALQKYVPKFTENGIEDLETILELTDKHLDAIDVPLGNKLKILKRIKSIRQEQGLSVPESRQQSARKAVETQPQKPEGKFGVAGPAKKQVVFADQPKTLADGAFDEVESHNSFVQALNAWRGVKTEQQQSTEPVKKKSFFASLGGDEWNINCLPSFQEGGTDAIQVNSQPRSACWQCYRLVMAPSAYGGKQFCGDKCLQVFKVHNQVTCDKAQCRRQFVKTQGCSRYGRWYCSQQCLDTDEVACRLKQQVAAHVPQESSESDFEL